ncbi:HYDIN protein, partial [Rhagologus leucostigma]|nr:HYDIN protein [Rhagologus leucostigma]
GETKAPKKEETEAPEKGKTKAPKKGETKDPEKGETKAPKKGETKTPKKGETKTPEKGETKAPKKGETKTPEKGETKAPEKGETKAPEEEETKAPEKEKTEISEDPAEMEKNLILRFQIYESSQQNVTQVYSYWDRVQGTMQLPVIQKENKSQPSAEQKDQKKTSHPREKVAKKPPQKSGGQKSLQSSQLERQSKIAEEAVRDEHVGVPCLDIKVTNPKDMLCKILKKWSLPTENQMLKHLELHPYGPPLPHGVLSMVDYPEERSGSAECTPDAKGSSAEGQPKTGKVASKDESPEENWISTESTESPQDPSRTRPESSSEAKKSTLQSASLPTEFLRLKRYRWIVPAQGEVELNVHFCPTKSGKFQQTLRFELVGIKHLYNLPCSGTGLYPSISQNPRLVFPQWRETMEDDEIIFKEYVESTKQFHFGPLLCGKSREWYVLPAPEQA